MKTLSIFDISPYLYAGGHYKKNTLNGDPIVSNGKYTANTLAVGGTAFFLQALLNARGDIAIAVDTQPQVKRMKNSGYKSARSHTTSITVERYISAEICRKCGYAVYEYEGYEADDIVHSICEQYKDQYDEIHLYLRDSDMLYLVDDKTSIEPVTRNQPRITKANYNLGFSKAAIPYNAIVLYKVLYGDPKDSIQPAILKHRAHGYWRALHNFPYLEGCGIKDLCKMALGSVVDQLDRAAAMSQLELVFPESIEVPKPHDLYDLELLKQWAFAMGIRSGAKFEPYGLAEFVNSTKERFISKGYPV